MKISGNSQGDAPIFQTIDTAPGYVRVAKAIEVQIVEGKLKVGDRLPTEGALAEQLGVHRSTVREGIRSLENSGLLKRAGGKRLLVTVPEVNSVAWANTRALGMRRATFNELWEVQMQIEPFIARLAADRIDAEQSERLQANITRLESNLEDDAICIRCDIEFHSIVADATNNIALAMAAAPIGGLLFSATLDLYERVRPARHRLLTAHKNIAEAILAGDSARAEKWMSRHIRDFRRGYEVGGFNMDSAIELDADMMGELG